MNHNLLYSPDMLLEAQAASQMYKCKKVISQLELVEASKLGNA